MDRPHRVTTGQAGTRRLPGGLIAAPPGALRRLPRDVGVALTALGIAGLIIPGPVPPGIPLLTAGVVFLWPGLLDRVGGWLGCRFPAAYRAALSAIDRASDVSERAAGRDDIRQRAGVSDRVELRRTAAAEGAATGAGVVPRAAVTPVGRPPR